MRLLPFWADLAASMCSLMARPQPSADVSVYSFQLSPRAAWQWAWYEILRATSARFAPVWGVVSGCHVKGQTSVEKETAGRQLNEVCGA